MKTKQRRSKQAIEKRRQELAELRDRLNAYEGGLDPETKATIIAQFQGYSERNAVLIAMQCPEATEVNGYRAWQQLGRQVRRGEKGIQILAPLGRRRDDASDDAPADAPDSAPADAPADAPGEGKWIEVAESRQRFRTISVFDLSQTDPIPAVNLLDLGRDLDAEDDLDD